MTLGWPTWGAGATRGGGTGSEAGSRREFLPPCLPRLPYSRSEGKPPFTVAGIALHGVSSTLQSHLATVAPEALLARKVMLRRRVPTST